MEKINTQLSDDEADTISQALDDAKTMTQENGYDSDTYPNYRRTMDSLDSAREKLDL